jgi:hypothetical protein
MLVPCGEHLVPVPEQNTDMQTALVALARLLARSAAEDHFFSQENTDAAIPERPTAVDDR